jgi:hypothetical protein
MTTCPSRIGIWRTIRHAVHAQIVAARAARSPGVPAVTTLLDPAVWARHGLAATVLLPAARAQTAAPPAGEIPTCETAARIAYVLRDVHVWPEYSIATTPDGAVLAETLPAPYRTAQLAATLLDLAPARRRRADTIRTQAEAVTSIGGYLHTQGYYHTLLDRMPRLWGT